MKWKNRYTVKQLADMAGVSIRTLHYYDQIGLLTPAAHGDNGYRYYDEDDLLRLQQILFFRELDISLGEIGAIVNRRDFHVPSALERHRQALQERVDRLNRLIQTIDNTILYLKGEREMSPQKLFEEWSEEKQKGYQKEVRKRWGDHAFKGTKEWNSYTMDEKEKIKAEGEVIYRDLLALMGKGYDHPEVQKAIARWHAHLRYFYEPSRERLMGLAQLYAEDPEFSATFRKIHPDMPAFLRQTIEYYIHNNMKD